MPILSLKAKLDYDGRLTNKVMDAVKTVGIISSKIYKTNNIIIHYNRLKNKSWFHAIRKIDYREQDKKFGIIITHYVTISVIPGSMSNICLPA